MIFNPGNEPSFTSPFLFNFVDRQDLTVNHSRAIAKAYYSATPGGLPGNSDAGAMESWVLWVMIGLYPMTGQTTFLIGSPWFDDLSISLGGGNSLHITSTGGSDTSFYVQSLKVNGKTWTKNWVEWSDVFENGGTMDFVLGPEPVDWATGPAPPSPGTENNGSRTRKSSGSEDGSGASASGGSSGEPTSGESDVNANLGDRNIATPVLASLLSVLGLTFIATSAWSYWRKWREDKARLSARSEKVGYDTEHTVGKDSCDMGAQKARRSGSS